MNSMASYESGQIGIRGILSDSAIGKTDSLQNSEREITKIEERMSLQMSDIRDEFSSQGNHIKWMEELLESDGRQAPTDGE
jgi:hypothetical protein